MGVSGVSMIEIGSLVALGMLSKEQYACFWVF